MRVEHSNCELSAAQWGKSCNTPSILKARSELHTTSATTNDLTTPSQTTNTDTWRPSDEFMSPQRNPCMFDQQKLYVPTEKSHVPPTLYTTLHCMCAMSCHLFPYKNTIKKLVMSLQWLTSVLFHWRQEMKESCNHSSQPQELASCSSFRSAVKSVERGATYVITWSCDHLKWHVHAMCVQNCILTENPEREVHSSRQEYEICFIVALHALVEWQHTDKLK